MEDEKIEYASEADYEGEYDDGAFMFLEIDGAAKVVAYLEDEKKLLIDDELVSFETYSQGEESFVKLTDGRTYKVLNELYA
jgi:hypothetical protein